MTTTKNLTAANKAIRALGLGPEHAAVVELVRSLARAVDADPCRECKAAQDAALWREYRQAVKELTEAGRGGGDDGGAADFLVSITTPRRTPVGDAPES